MNKQSQRKEAQRKTWKPHQERESPGPQRSGFFWSAARIATSTSGKVQHRKFMDFQSLRARSESEKSDWLRIRNDYSAHVQIIGPFQRSRFLVLIQRSVVSGDENVQHFTNFALLLLSPTILPSPRVNAFPSFFTSFMNVVRESLVPGYPELQ